MSFTARSCVPRLQYVLQCHPAALVGRRTPLTNRVSSPSVGFGRSTAVQAQRRYAASDTAKKLHEKALAEEERKVTEPASAQRRENDRPWQRERSDAQPESTSPDPSQGDKTKGRLLTTPTRLLKLILPMPFYPDQKQINLTKEERQKQPDGAVEALALLVHPQQPLSYVERLIQAEIPPIRDGEKERLPEIAFRAEADHDGTKEEPKSGNINVASYSGLGHEGPEKKTDDANWVRWSGSTEVGDFIRDAARGREFAVVIEGLDHELRVAVPSFKDRTHFMRMRLRRMSREIDDMAKIKHECDMLAHKGAHRLAKGGFAGLTVWWGIVYGVTFHTSAGWDLVEPVTYLAGLTTIMGGYLWFLYISRDLSYKAAMNVTVSRRQGALYQERGFDLAKWEHNVSEANAMRREIKNVATEYDIEWDETRDLGSEEVKRVLEKEKKGRKKEASGQEDEDEAAQLDAREEGRAEQKQKMA